jgi:diguanylate cyclase (GGDEF)-like protein
MNDMLSNTFQENSQEHQDFLEENANLLRELDNTWRDAVKEEWNANAINRMRYLLHQLIGTSSIMGYKQTEDAARNLKIALEETSIFQQARERVQEIEIEFELLWQVIRTEKPEQDNVEDQSTNKTNKTLNDKDQRSRHLVYLADDDSIQAEKLAAQIAHFGYQVETFNTLGAMMQAVKQKTPEAILMDIIFPESPTAGLEAAKDILKQNPQIPIVFISEGNEIEIRLHAVKAGGKAYFTKPIEVGTLIDTLDKTISGESASPPYRVLLIEDSRFQATFFARKLQNVGMETRILIDPLQINKTLDEFNPDLILLDMYMPAATGMELAKVIRQIDTYISIPIVFLSAETDKEKQLEAMKFGGDDFLDKSIKPEHLISTISTRVVRYRELRALMMRDGLTGLLNHTTIKERLEQEVLRADRNGLPLSYIMIDIDHFKKVNDTYGHPTGDRVLKSLSQLFTQRLRRTDIIGRYGGEEFAIILPNTSINNALGVMEELRNSFENIRHRSNEEEFSVTFSCGIASFDRFKTQSELNEAADKALYIAKREGRNQTICSDFIRT